MLFSIFSTSVSAYNKKDSSKDFKEEDNSYTINSFDYPSESIHVSTAKENGIKTNSNRRQETNGGICFLTGI